jgi:hypothetical protein
MKYCPKCGYDLEKELAKENKSEYMQQAKLQTILGTIAILILIGYIVLFT